MTDTAILHYTEPEYKILNEEKESIVGAASEMKELFRQVDKLLYTNTRVIISGETGVGKEMFAKALHYNSKTGRHNKPFCTVDCGNIPSELLESELFGHNKGSFTGAINKKIGKFEYADGGTIFLDEIANMSMHLQAKLLRVSQNNEFTPVGENTPKKVDVRIISATNKNLEDEVAKGNFREDLYYRLNVFPLNIPPLRDRKVDIPLIVEYLIKKFNASKDYLNKFDGITGDAVEKLVNHEWKGNIRELENLMERAYVLNESKMIGPDKIIFFNNNKKDESSSSVDTIKNTYKDIHVKIKPKQVHIQEQKYSDDTWFSRGVMAARIQDVASKTGIPFQTLSKRFYSIIENSTVNKKIYYQYNKSNSGKHFILYLTPSAFDPLILDRDNIDEDNLNKAIELNEFNELVKHTFGGFNTSEILHYTGQPYQSALTKAVNKKDIYILKGSPDIYFIKLNQAKHIMKNGDTEALTLFETDIKKRYSYFVQRKFMNKNSRSDSIHNFFGCTTTDN